MTYQEIDLIFPYIIFTYGVIMLFVLYNPALMRIADEKMPQQILGLFKQHRVMGIICFYVGGLWTLQQIWYNSL